MPSSARWSSGSSAVSPSPHQAPPSSAAGLAAEDAVLGLARPARRPGRPSFSHSVRGSATAAARPSADTQRPGRSWWVGARPHRVLHPGPQHRLVHDAGVDRPSASDPTSAATPAGSRSPGSGVAVCGQAVPPRPDQALARAGQPLQQPRDRVGVAVLPAADGVDGALDGGVVLASPSRASSSRRGAGAAATSRPAAGRRRAAPATARASARRRRSRGRAARALASSM